MIGGFFFTSSPVQISFRPLKDTSPSSLPHTSSPPFPHPVQDPPSTIKPPRRSLDSSDLPTADAPTRVGGSKATTAHVSTNAQPTMSLPVAIDDDDEDDDMEVDGDGSSIMGRAANIANTAKDLLGALWYGANESHRQGKLSQPVQRGAVSGLPADGRRAVSGGSAMPAIGTASVPASDRPNGNSLASQSNHMWDQRRLSR